MFSAATSYSDVIVLNTPDRDFRFDRPLILYEKSFKSFVRRELRGESYGTVIWLDILAIDLYKRSYEYSSLFWSYLDDGSNGDLFHSQQGALFGS
jgi:hypothetical protein